MEASSLGTTDPERLAAWKSWALGHADRIDPLLDKDIFDRNVSDYGTLRE